MSKRFQVSAPLFDFGQLLSLPFHRNVMEMVIYQYSNCWVILSGSIALISLTGSITLMDILITMIQEYSDYNDTRIFKSFFGFAAPFRQGVTRTCEPSCEGPETQVCEVFLLRRSMSFLASFVQEANVQLASC